MYTCSKYHYIQQLDNICYKDVSYKYIIRMFKGHVRAAEHKEKI